MIIISLNIRGLGGGMKLRYMRKLIAESAVLVCIQEIKSTSITEAKCFDLWGDSNIGWIFNEEDVGVGSMLTMWHKETFTYINHQIGKGYIVIFGHHLKSKKIVLVINVYSPCNMSEKKSLGEELSNIKISK